jgi:hypothetical protein
MSNVYFIEQLVPVPALEWNEEECDTLAWSQIPNLSFVSVTQARIHMRDHFDKRLSYRVTDGGRVWAV